MPRFRPRVGPVLLGLVALPCPSAAADESRSFSPYDWAIIQTVSPLPDPADITNKYRDSAAVLGQKLFFEPRLSAPIQDWHAPGMTARDGYSDSEWFDAQSEPEGPPVQNGSRLLSNACDLQPPCHGIQMMQICLIR
jgi:cytochrome c peroxidase